MSTPFVSQWGTAKQALEQSTGISMDALHVLVGTIALLIVAMLLRRPVSSWIPWFAVLVLQLLNEALDITADVWPDLGAQLSESAKDTTLTMALPTALVLTARYLPALYRPSR